MKSKSIVVVAAAALLAACGGGGGGAGGPTGPVVLSATQQNFETTTKADFYVALNWYLPNTDVAPTPGTHYLYYGVNAVSTSPQSGAVLNSQSSVNLTTTLALPSMAQQSVSRVVKNGAIYVANGSSRQMWSYSGNDVVLTTYATDGTTALFAADYDDWSAPIALSGAIGTTPIVNSFLSFTRLSEPSNFDFSQAWLPGSSYFTRKGFQQATTLFLNDWTGRSYDVDVSPYPGTETTIETLFANPGFASGISVDGVAYTLAGGSISSIQGARVWVATNPKPASASPTTGYVAFVELNGKIYFGSLRKAGARLSVIDGVDSTIVDDYNIRLNGTAVQSLKQAVRF
jgi:hypothetical protein